MDDVMTYVERLGREARRAAGELAATGGAAKVAALRRIAAALRAKQEELLEANARDLGAAEGAGVDAPLVHRLRLDAKKVAGMADGVEQIAAQVDPVGQVIEGYVRPNGLRIEKRRVPLGVVLFFYESRPNVTSDAAALCLKSGNAVILRGGKEALHSNRAIVTIISSALIESGLPSGAVQLVESIDRALVPHLLKLDKYIDVAIPRGGKSLITAVVKDAAMPVLKHYDGNCHIYIDSATAGIEQQVREVCVNAKTSYPGGAVCNAVEHLLFHKDALELLPPVCAELMSKGVEVRADERARRAFPAAKPASADDWDTEYLSFIVGVKVVDSLDEAIDHINAHGSHHTDAILSTSASNIDRFVKRVDSASVIVNASTRFADGGEYGLGAEIGISTDKLHARGPMGAGELTTYKWIVTGEGHVR
ncbi:MAG TPA: glutamate-5-semialdehyde dehydrogenase [Tepidisphaeraceae bacterium]|nr:glutamate-5-semialdehyde dehydrogenase [Tepidisphaeraceae bacterium]